MCVIKFIADEDPAMKIAIPIVFKNMHHRYCRFHITCGWRHDLDRLYFTNKGLKVELESLFNFLLGPTDFETAWKKTVEIWEKRAPSDQIVVGEKENVDNGVLQESVLW
jgi:hypothetical protein